VAQVLSDSEEPETRMRILNCLAVIVERMEHQVGHIYKVQDNNN
jgi:hypothetical protein